MEHGKKFVTIKHSTLLLLVDSRTLLKTIADSRDCQIRNFEIFIIQTFADT